MTWKTNTKRTNNKILWRGYSSVVEYWFFEKFMCTSNKDINSPNHNPLPQIFWRELVLYAKSTRTRLVACSKPGSYLWCWQKWLVKFFTYFVSESICANRISSFWLCWWHGWTRWKDKKFFLLIIDIKKEGIPTKTKKYKPVCISILACPILTLICYPFCVIFCHFVSAYTKSFTF